MCIEKPYSYNVIIRLLNDFLLTVIAVFSVKFCLTYLKETKAATGDPTFHYFSAFSFKFIDVLWLFLVKEPYTGLLLVVSKIKYRALGLEVNH